MAISKSSCNYFIDRVEEKANKSVREKHGAIIESMKNGHLEKYSKLLEDVQRAANDLSDMIKHTFGLLADDPDVKYRMSGYGSIVRDFSKFTGKAIINIAFIDSDFPEVEKQRNLRDKEIMAVKENYHKVRLVCKGFSTGNQMLNYLKELGFDTASIEETEKKALVADIDKSKLFVCGDNK